MATFDLTPQFSYKMTQTFQTIQTPFESGVVQTRAKWPRPVRRWELVWTHANDDEAEELRAFYRDHNGAADTFSYTPVDAVPRPYLAPTVTQSESTATEKLGARTRFAAYTWSDSSGNETRESLNTAELMVSTGYLLVVTPPAFPNSVDKAYIYVGTSGANLKKQATPVSTSGNSWTEPTDGFDEGGDSPPTANSLTETVTAHFDADSLGVIKNSAYDYSMQVAIVEVL